VSIFVDVRVSAEDFHHARISGTCLSFPIKKDGVIALASQVPFAEGVQERATGRCRGDGHIHDTANDALTDGKADITLLAREILCNPYSTLPSGLTQRCCEAGNPHTQKPPPFSREFSRHIVLPFG
jgi:2,4-dienoyl-CoA reductase-like NADH-dependent reductase (Old Yellow Enzyme family)